jgi:hypothetical protein
MAEVIKLPVDYSNRVEAKHAGCSRETIRKSRYLPDGAWVIGRDGKRYRGRALTPDQRKRRNKLILQAVAAGISHREIAAGVECSVTTVGNVAAAERERKQEQRRRWRETERAKKQGQTG